MSLKRKLGWAAGLIVVATAMGALHLDDGPVMTRAQYRVDAPMRYLYRETKTTLRTMGEFIDATNAAFEAQSKAGTLRREGAFTFIYEGADGNPDTKFTLKVGLPVSKDQKPVEGFEVADLPKFQSVSSVYCGPMSGIKDAYDQLFGQLFEQGYEPAGISRETYLHWEGMDSENDITLISVEVKPKG